MRISDWSSDWCSSNLWPAWFVFDQNYRDKYPIGPIAPGEALPQGMAMMADSVEALATAAGIDAAGLAATIERFNGHAEGGTDPDFGRGTKLWSHSWGDSRQLNPILGLLAKAPFYATQLARAIGRASGRERVGQVG